MTPPPPAIQPSPTGTVHLVGAGPGDPELFTLRARRLLESCDCLIYDALVDPAVVSWTRPGCELIYVGKRRGHHSATQDEIEFLLVSKAREHRQVVRLKGGDPFIFGRGGEEALTLKAHGIAYEIVPGVSSALAASAFSGTPLTHRGLSQGVAFVTAHEGGADAIDWNALAKSGLTLALFMAMSGLESTSRRLIDGGLAPETPCTVVQWASCSHQRVLTSTLEHLPADVTHGGFGAPSIVIIGKVASLSETLAWFNPSTQIASAGA